MSSNISDTQNTTLEAPHSAVKRVEAALENIAQHNQELKAFTLVCSQRAKHKSTELTQRSNLSNAPLAGANSILQLSKTPHLLPA